MAEHQGRFVRIASLWPLGAIAEKPTYLHQKQFTLKPVLPGEIAYLDVYDDEEMVFMGHERSMPVTVPAMDTAKWLVSRWTESLPLGGKFNNPLVERPGIWICEGKEATAQELTLNRTLQTNFAKRKVAEGDVFHADPQKKFPVIRMHLVMADLLGVTGKPWQINIDRSSLVECPFCGHPMRADLPTCAQCRGIVNDRLYKERTEAVKSGKIDELREQQREQRNAQLRRDSLPEDPETVMAEVEAAMAAQE